jgi:MFS transporter, putative metabolite:H+ symporter
VNVAGAHALQRPDLRPPVLSAASIAARIDRLPMSRWHARTRITLGAGTFFDGFDMLAIAFVLPILIPLWSLSPQQIGALIAVGAVGQGIGAVIFGYLAERSGRIPTARIAVALFGVMSFVCATAQSYDQLLVERFLQGLGLGGYMPIAATYISEIAPGQRRGGYFMMYEGLFVVGILAVAIAGAWIVPRYGWQWLFMVGVAPALMSAFMQRVCPESPRWLAAKGRLREADDVLTMIERKASRDGAVELAPPRVVSASVNHAPTRWTELLGASYRYRTISTWALWFCSFVVSFGLSTWLPSLYRTVYGLPVQQALNYSLIANAVGLLGVLACALTIDRFGRRSWFVGAFALCGLSILALALLGARAPISYVALAASIGSFGIYAGGSALYLYTSEIYPTRMRALGIGWASLWLRAAAVVSPLMVGYLLSREGIDAVFFAFAGAAAIGACLSKFGVLETRGRALEEIAS